MEYLNRLLRKGGGKKSEPVGHQLPSEKSEFSEENSFSYSQHSTPKKHQDCDTESDTTAEYESAGEASPWEKPSNVSALADYLAGVHLSTPNKIHTKLTSFPFSPISAEDECDDDEVTAIISSRSYSSPSHSSSIHERGELSLPGEDKTMSAVLDTSFSDIDLDEFKNSKPCKRHSEANIDSETLSHSEVQLSDAEDKLSDTASSLSKGELHFKTDFNCCSNIENIENLPVLLSDGVAIKSSIIDSDKLLCESVHKKFIPETISPTVNVAINFNNFDDGIAVQNSVTNSAVSKNIVDGNFCEKYSAEMERTSSETSLNKSSNFLVVEKDNDSLVDPLKVKCTAVTSKVLEANLVNDYVGNTKQKIDIILNTKKESVSNVISETKQQIDNFFKHKSPLKELSGSNVPNAIDTTNEIVNKTKTDTSPQRNAVFEKKNSPISAAKQKIDNLFRSISPKKDILSTEISGNVSLQEASVVQDHYVAKSSIRESNTVCTDNVLMKTEAIEKHKDVPSESCLNVTSSNTVNGKHNIINTAKQQIDRIFKSLSPQKGDEVNKVVRIPNLETVLTQDVSKTDETQFSLNKVTSSLEQNIVDVQQKIDKLMITSCPHKESFHSIVSEECIHDLVHTNTSVSEIGQQTIEKKKDVEDTMLSLVKHSESGSNRKQFIKIDTEVNKIDNSHKISAQDQPVEDLSESDSTVIINETNFDLNRHSIQKDKMEKIMESLVDNEKLNCNLSQVPTVNFLQKEISKAVPNTADNKLGEIEEHVYQNITEKDEGIFKCASDISKITPDSFEIASLKTSLMEHCPDVEFIDIYQKENEDTTSLIVEPSIAITDLTINGVTQVKVQESRNSFLDSSSVSMKEEDIKDLIPQKIKMTKLEFRNRNITVDEGTEDKGQEHCGSLYSLPVNSEKEKLKLASSMIEHVIITKKDEEIEDSSPQNITETNLGFNKEDLTVEVTENNGQERCGSLHSTSINLEKEETKLASNVVEQVIVNKTVEEIKDSTSQNITESNLGINKQVLQVEKAIEIEGLENCGSLHSTSINLKKEELKLASNSIEQVIVNKTVEEIKDSSPQNITETNLGFNKEDLIVEVTENNGQERCGSLHSTSINLEKKETKLASNVVEQVIINRAEEGKRDSSSQNITETNLGINKRGLPVEDVTENNGQERCGSLHSTSINPEKEESKLASNVMKQMIVNKTVEEMKESTSQNITDSNLGIGKQDLPIKEVTENKGPENCDPLNSSSVNSQKEELKLASNSIEQVIVNKTVEEIKDSSSEKINESNMGINKQDLPVEEVTEGKVQEQCVSLQSSSENLPKEEVKLVSNKIEQVILNKAVEAKESTSQKITDSNLGIIKQDLIVKEVTKNKDQEHCSSLHSSSVNPDKEEVKLASNSLEQVIVSKKVEEINVSISQNITETNLRSNKRDIMVEEVTKVELQENQNSFLHTAPTLLQKEELNASSYSHDQMNIGKEQETTEHIIPQIIAKTKLHVNKQGLTVEKGTEGQVQMNDSYINSSSVNPHEGILNTASSFVDEISVDKKEVNAFLKEGLAPVTVDLTELSLHMSPGDSPLTESLNINLEKLGHSDLHIIQEAKVSLVQKTDAEPTINAAENILNSVAVIENQTEVNNSLPPPKHQKVALNVALGVMEEIGKISEGTSNTTNLENGISSEVSNKKPPSLSLASILKSPKEDKPLRICSDIKVAPISIDTEDKIALEDKDYISLKLQEGNLTTEIVCKKETQLSSLSSPQEDESLNIDCDKNDLIVVDARKSVLENKILLDDSHCSRFQESILRKEIIYDKEECMAENFSSEQNILPDSIAVVSKLENFKPSSSNRTVSKNGTSASDLFSEIFQEGKKQIIKMASLSEENSLSNQNVFFEHSGSAGPFEGHTSSINDADSNEVTLPNCSKTSSITKCNEVISNNPLKELTPHAMEHASVSEESKSFESVENYNKSFFSDKVKSPPFACSRPSDSIPFISSIGDSLSLSPIDSIAPSSKFSGSPGNSPSNLRMNNISSGNNVSDTFPIVSCYKRDSSSAEIGMETSSKSSFQSDIVSNQINNFSSSAQATLNIQGEMTTRNEKISYNFNKIAKDIQGSPIKSSEELKYCGLNKTFQLDDLSKSTIERKSYEDLLDRCLEQERLLGFDEKIKEEADKLIQELANASSGSDISQPNEFPSANASEAGPVTADEDLSKADLFQDATLFDFDYLSKIGKGKLGRSKLARESLFLKFDPLVAAAVTPEPAEMAQADSSSDPIGTPPRALLPNCDDKLVNITPNEETICSPASSTVATPPRAKPRSSSCTATPTLRHEILSKEISKLQDLMLRQECSYQEQIAACSEEVEQLREKVAELEARENQENLQDKLVATEAESSDLRKQLSEAVDNKKQLMMIMEEYEKTISQVVTMREDDKKKFQLEKEQIISERDEAVQHLRNMEIAFNDVHLKYEKCKEAIEAFKYNEEQYKISLNENRKTIIQQEENYQKLKDHAAQKLEEANIEITEMKKAHQAELAKMVAVQRKMEIQVKSLEESLEQKKREAAELTKICDDLITKVEQ